MPTTTKKATTKNSKNKKGSLAPASTKNTDSSERRNLIEEKHIGTSSLMEVYGIPVPIQLQLENKILKAALPKRFNDGIIIGLSWNRNNDTRINLYPTR